MIRDVVSVLALEPYRLRVRFDDGSEGTFDVAAALPFEGVFAPLRDASFFARAAVNLELGTVVWPNGADLDPMVLYAAVTGRPISLRPEFHDGASVAQVGG